MSSLPDVIHQFATHSIDDQKTPVTSKDRLSFPPEILDLVISIIRDDIPSLKACSTACRALASLCQARLFSRVDVDCLTHSFLPGPSESHCRFFDIISKSTEIASYVREIRFIRGESAIIYGWEKYGGERNPYYPVARILSMLPRLERLVLRATSTVFAWDEASTELKNALYTVAQLPTLCYVDLGKTTGVPTLLLSTFTSLRHLRCSEIQGLVPNTPEGSQISKFARPKLLSLSLLEPASTNILHLACSPDSPFDIRGLSDLTVSGLEYSHFLRLLAICSRTLQSLKMALVPTAHALNDPNLTFHRLESLTSITIMLRDNDSPELLRHFIRLLDTLPSPELLCNVIVVLKLAQLPYGDQKGWDRYPWDQLDALISRAAQCKLDIILVHPGFSRQLQKAPQVISEAIGNALPKLAQSGKLEVSGIYLMPCFLWIGCYWDVQPEL